MAGAGAGHYPQPHPLRDLRGGVDQPGHVPAEPLPPPIGPDQGGDHVHVILTVSHHHPPAPRSAVVRGEAGVAHDLSDHVLPSLIGDRVPPVLRRQPHREMVHQPRPLNGRLVEQAGGPGWRLQPPDQRPVVPPARIGTHGLQQPGNQPPVRVPTCG